MNTFSAYVTISMPTFTFVVDYDVYSGFLISVFISTTYPLLLVLLWRYREEVVANM